MKDNFKYRFMPPRFQVDWHAKEVQWRIENRESIRQHYEQIEETGYHGVQFQTFEDFFKWTVERWKARNNLFHLSKNILGFKDMAAIHREVSDWLVMTKDVLKRGLFMPRGHYKTTLGTICYTTFLVINDFGIRVAIYTGDMSLGVEMMGNPLRDLWVGDNLAYLFPEAFSTNKGDYPKWGQESFSIKRPKNDSRKAGNTVLIMSEKSGGTGKHFDFYIRDDIVTEDNHLTQTARAYTKSKADFLVPKRDPGNSVAESLTIGTIYHWDDYYWDVFLPEICSEREMRNIKVNPSHNGIIKDSLVYIPVAQGLGQKKEFIFPEKFDEAEIERRRKGFSNPNSFYSQYYLHPGAAEDRIFEDPYNLPRYTTLPSPMSRFVGIDWASEEKRQRGDETVFYYCGIDAQGFLYLLHHIAGNWLLQEAAELLIEGCIEFNVSSIAYENSVQVLQKTIERAILDAADDRAWPISLEPIGRMGQRETKEEFIKLRLQDFVNSRTLFVRSGDADLKFMRQLEEFPNGKHDDRIDAVSIALDSQFARRPSAAEMISQERQIEDPVAREIERRLKVRDSARSYFSDRLPGIRVRGLSGKASAGNPLAINRFGGKR